MKFKKTVELQYQDLQSCALFKASNDVRFYLCGVYVGAGAIVATNGHTMLLCDEPEVIDLDLIIPKEAIDYFIRKVGKNPKVKKVSLRQIDEYWMLKHINQHGHESIEVFYPVTGKFPDFKRVDIPKPEQYAAKNFPRFNFDYLGLFRKAAVMHGGVADQPTLMPTSVEGSCYVEINDRVHGIIMPMRI